MFRNQVSEAITAIHPEEVSISGGIISVESNVADANVTLTQNNIILYNGTLVNNQIEIDLASFTSEEVVKVTLTKPNRTPYRGEIAVNEALSLSDFENGFVIYPNPAKEVINIKSNRADLGLASLKLFDLNGRLLVNYEKISLASEYSIPVQNLLSGIYVLSIQNGDFQKNQKIVVK
ncbi:T9SS type A sorting domain-containing protein [Flavobacterium piscinae]|uniref:T9SS type A sorting domain-containing protein n=1 Tax=Flavobacterium piscinae TaxID=2506424 RepID=UPI0019AD3147|nr:T9SS type A sorting domain-containing protein [Flavobacterium piscinae]MBC8884249.1 T9SS type A sorting domain-containing protein [Flavobacterium piscinae]